MQERFSRFNESMNDLPRRLLIILGMFALLALAFFLFPYVAPFIVALVLSALIDPLVRLLTRWFHRLRFARTLAAAICTFLLLGLILVMLLTLSSRGFAELKSLAFALPGWASSFVEDLLNWFNGLDFEWDLLGDTVLGYIQDAIISLGKSITSSATSLATLLARGAWTTATVGLPKVLLFTTLTFMGTFYMSSDREKIFAFVRSLLPERMAKGSALVKDNIFKALLSQLRAQLIMMVVTFTELMIGFTLLDMNYALLLAIVISILDALPVIGTGLFLIPFALFGLITGNFQFAIGMALLYIIIGIVRQTLEPRILGKHMGLHPLATMMAMYAGYRLIGFMGMLLGPMILLLCKAVISFVVDPTEDEPVASEPQVVAVTAKKAVAHKGYKRKKK